MVEGPEARSDLQELARRYNRELIADRRVDMEVTVLEISRDMEVNSRYRRATACS